MPPKARAIKKVPQKQSKVLLINFGENNKKTATKKTVFVAVDPKIIPKGIRLTSVKKGKIIKHGLKSQISKQKKNSVNSLVQP